MFRGVLTVSILEVCWNVLEKNATSDFVSKPLAIANHASSLSILILNFILLVFSFVWNVKKKHRWIEYQFIYYGHISDKIIQPKHLLRHNIPVQLPTATASTLFPGNVKPILLHCMHLDAGSWLVRCIKAHFEEQFPGYDGVSRLAYLVILSSNLNNVFRMFESSTSGSTRQTTSKKTFNRQGNGLSGVPSSTICVS